MIYLKNSLIGCLLEFSFKKYSDEEMLAILAPFFKGLSLTEIEWFKVSEEIQEGKCFSIYPFAIKDQKKRYNFVYVNHASPVVTKAIRHHIKKVGIILSVNPAINSVSVTPSRPGPLQNIRLNRLAALMRRGEVLAGGGKWTLNNYQSQQTGDCMGWYLHDSERMLMYGSFKKPAVRPTKMNPKQLLNLLAVFLSDDVPISPELGCPGESCRGKACSFLTLNLTICKQIQAIETNPFARLLIPQKIQSAKVSGFY